jgi:hypothetical protein
MAVLCKCNPSINYMVKMDIHDSVWTLKLFLFKSCPKKISQLTASLVFPLCLCSAVVLRDRSADFLHYTEVVHLFSCCNSHGFGTVSLVCLIMWNYVWEMKSVTQKPFIVSFDIHVIFMAVVGLLVTPSRYCMRFSFIAIPCALVYRLYYSWNSKTQVCRWQKILDRFLINWHFDRMYVGRPTFK